MKITLDQWREIVHSVIAPQWRAVEDWTTTTADEVYFGMLGHYSRDTVRRASIALVRRAGMRPPSAEALAAECRKLAAETEKRFVRVHCERCNGDGTIAVDVPITLRVGRNPRKYYWAECVDTLDHETPRPKPEDPEARWYAVRVPCGCEATPCLTDRGGDRVLASASDEIMTHVVRAIGPRVDRARARKEADMSTVG